MNAERPGGWATPGPAPERADPGPDVARRRDGDAAARPVLSAVAAAVDDRLAGGFPAPIDLGALDDDGLGALDDALGTGAVSLIVGRPVRFRVREAAMAGVWRVEPVGPTADGGGRAIEVARFPTVARAAIEAEAGADLLLDPATITPEEAMNARPVLAELRERMQRYRPGGDGDAMDLGTLPLSPRDRELIDAALGVGPVRAQMRDTGTSRIDATACRHVWRVRHFNAAETCVADLVEIVDVPVTLAAPDDDVRDGAARLAALLEERRP